MVLYMRECNKLISPHFRAFLVEQKKGKQPAITLSLPTTYLFSRNSLHLECAVMHCDSSTLFIAQRERQINFFTGQ